MAEAWAVLCTHLGCMALTSAASLVIRALSCRAMRASLVTMYCLKCTQALRLRARAGLMPRAGHTLPSSTSCTPLASSM
ncbi:hypothetical protein V8C86DRAFT_2836970 [Haematococcus lacustris]